MDILVSEADKSIVGAHNVIVDTDCPAGYSLSIQTDSAKIYRNADVNSEYFLNSASGSMDTPSVLGDNEWGFSLANDGRFSGVPLSQTEIKKVDSAGKTSTPVYYGVRANGELASGNYTGTVIYTITPSSGCFGYKATFNAGDGSGSYGDQVLQYNESVNLKVISANFSKSKYRLTSWKDQNGNDYDATSTSININANNVSELVLTAQYTPTLHAISNMQDMRPEICAATTTPKVTGASDTVYDTDGSHMDDIAYVPQHTLRDIRDNETYIVRKLADGNCWMSQNLRIVGSRTLTSADSDVSSNWTLPAASTSGFSDNTAVNVGPVNSTYGNGAYYTWCAATAGTCSSATSSGAEASASVCPKGWRLPPNSGNKSYYNLITTVYGYSNGGQLTAQPLQFAYGGSYYFSSFYYGGSNGLYCSSTANSLAYAYYSYFDSSDVLPQRNDGRYSGFSVRCVAR